MRKVPRFAPILVILLIALTCISRPSEIIHATGRIEGWRESILQWPSAESMTKEQIRLSPLLGPGFQEQDGSSITAQPGQLFSIMRNLPEFAAFDDLTVAAVVGDIEKTRDLLDNGADPNGSSQTGTTPLIEALSHNHPDIGELLLNRGADASRPSRSGWTPLHLAASNGWANLVEQFLSKNVDVDAMNENGWTPLILATMRKHVDVVKLLLDQGANTEIRDTDGATAIIYATKGGEEESGGDFDCLAALVGHGADPNSFDKRGWTALMGAAFYGDIRSVRLLVEHGAEIDAKDYRGEKALSLAEGSEHQQIAAFLKQVGL